MAEKQGEIVETLGGEQLFTGTLAAKDPMLRTQVPPPEGTPAKFWDPDTGQLRTQDLLKSYAELEKKLTAPKDPPADPVAVVSDPPPADPPPEGEPPEGKPAEEKPAEEERPEDKPPEEKSEGDEESVDMEAAMGNAQKVYAETGQLTPEAREPFLKVGFSNEQIDLYIAGVKAYERGLQNVAMKAAGVSDYAEVVKATEWAAQNWSEKQIRAFNSQTGDVETIGMAVGTLFSAYRAANPAEPSEGRLTNINSGITHGDVYTREAEFMKDLEAADKARDVDARRQAVAKMARSMKAKSIQK